MIAVNSDAHHRHTLETGRRFGVAMARRGWLEAGNVVNALPLGGLLKRLGAGR
jgi:histidinol phosphatase-like PHP family hydrolase